MSVEGCEIVNPRVQLRKLVGVAEKLGEYESVVTRSRLVRVCENSRVRSISKALG